MPFLALNFEERTMSQGVWGVPGNWKRQGMDFSLEPAERGKEKKKSLAITLILTQ